MEDADTLNSSSSYLIKLRYDKHSHYLKEYSNDVRGGRASMELLEDV